MLRRQLMQFNKFIYEFYFKFQKYVPIFIFVQLLCAPTLNYSTEFRQILDTNYLSLQTKYKLSSMLSFINIGNIIILYPNFYSYYSYSQYSIYFDKINMKIEFFKKSSTHLQFIIDLLKVKQLYDIMIGGVYFSQFVNLDILVDCNNVLTLSSLNNIHNMLFIFI